MERLTHELMAVRASREVKPNTYVNLGAGLPLISGQFIDPNEVVQLTETGVLGYGPVTTEPSEMDGELVNAYAQPITRFPGMSIFDMCTALAIMRRGNLVDLTILGGLQVSEKGDLANWVYPGRAGSIGGAMDAAVGCKRLVVLMEHTTRKGEPRLLKECSYPLTAKRCVNRVITDIAVIDITPQGMVLKEVVHGTTPEEVQAVTEPKLKIAEDLREMDL